MHIECTRTTNRTGQVFDSKVTPRRRALLATLLAICVVSFTVGCVGNLNGQPPGSKQQLSLRFSPTNLNFGNVPVGKKTSQAASVTNTSADSVTITQIVSSNSQFTISGVAFPLTLAPGQVANFLVWFNGSTPGKTAAMLTFQGDSTSASAEIRVSATAATPQAQLVASPMSLDAGSATVGSKTTSNITLSNTGTADLTISVITVTGAPFNITGITTPKVISAGQAATIGVTYSPTAVTTDIGSISLVSNDPASPTVIALSGKGTSTPVGHLILSPSTLTFGNVSVGGSSMLSTSVTNNGQAAVHISQIFASGTGFSETGLPTPATIAAGQSAQVQVTFAPNATGIAGGTVAIVSDAPGVAPGLALSGTGVQPAISLSPASISFGSLVNGQSKSQPVTILNTGTANLTITQLASTAAGVTVSGITTPLTIAAGQSNTFNVQYAPQTTGSTTGSISVASNAPNSPASVSVTGTGVAATTTLTVSPTSLSFGNVNTGSSANQSVTITNTGNSATTISQITMSAPSLSATGIATPLALNPGQSASLSVKFTPTSATTVSGSISIVNGQGSATSVSVAGAGVQGTLAVSPASVSFANVFTGSTNSQAVQLTNTGNASLTITQANVTGSGWSTSGLLLPVSLSAGQSASFNVQYIPQTAGTVTGSLSLVSNAANATAAVALNGSSIVATRTLSVTPSSLSFGTVAAGSTATQLVTLTNTGNASVAISQITASGTGFALSGVTAAVTLSVGQSASFSVQFSPAAGATDTGTVSIASNATNVSSIALSGSGPAATKTLSVSPASLNFGSVSSGSTSTQMVTLTNGGNAPVTISQIAATGTGFTLSGATVPVAIAVGQSTSFSVRFSPTAAGTDSGSVAVTSDATNSPASIALSGSSPALTHTLSVSASSLSFGSVNTGSSASQTVTLTNTGNADVAVSQISVTGTGFALSGAGTSVTVPVGMNFSFSVQFSPSSAGSDTGSVSISSNATGSPAAIALSGTGVAQPTQHSVQLSWTSSPSTIVGYNVYRSTTSGTGYILVNGSLVGPDAFDDTTVQSGTTYYYVTTAVDGSGNESGYSNEAQAIVP
jgi:Abnormal spindle-like microcephaly-assoc'd, ASPM-SPD-2-Hydin/HYDIN/CFA65/VesB-like, Ig-like domain